MNNRALTILVVLVLLSFSAARASHIVGGEFTYIHLGDSSSGGLNFKIYQVSLSIYEDCLTGSPSAIAQDNPAFIGVFDAITGVTVHADSVNFVSAIQLPTDFQNSCAKNVQATCLIKKTFVKTYALPANSDGYVISYERCCRNASVVNIINPDQNGSTFYCIIPPGNESNNSAVFTHFPPQIICLNTPLIYDNSATDADGDSLSYGFCSALNGATGMNAKPWPPTYPVWGDSVGYVSPPFSPQVPFTGFPPITINPVTGLITGTPNAQGRFLVTVFCDEWRHGVRINRIHREFQFVVQPCTRSVIASVPQFSTDYNTYIIDCKNYTVNFVNNSIGGFAYKWDFGVPGATGDTSNEFEPTFTYPDTGTYTMKLWVNPGTTCADSIMRLVKVYPSFTAAFSDSGNQCPGSAIYFQDLSAATIKPITNWLWNFGDGNTSIAQNPTHNYSSGGTYNVILVSENAKHCIDTAFNQVVIETFKPFAGNDTIIVKGSSILFDAIGGVKYTWSPSTHLNDTSIYNPLGFYADTGHYTYAVHVISSYGCAGDDSIKVTVVGNAEFVVPTAFTPNGDGRNDYFRPLAVGYSSLNYFRVFNRWGQRVYSSNSLDAGWDGTFNNARADIGTYYWEISFVDRYGTNGTLKGDVTLIR